MNKQSSGVGDSLDICLGESEIYGYVKDFNYKNAKTNIIMYNVEWGSMKVKYDGMIRVVYKGKINLVQDQKIRLTVNLELPENYDPGFDYVEYLRRKNIYIVGNGEYLEIIGHKKSITYYLSDFKNKIVFKIRKIYVEPEASLLLGLVTGYRADFDEVFKEQLSKTGTTHIIAISGFNISLIISLIMGFKRHFGRRLVGMSVFCISVLFCILTGSSPSIVRATVMAVVVLIGKELGRESYPSILLLLTASIMVLFNPYILWDLSFQLSFLSTIGLVYLSSVFSLLFKMKYLEYFYSTMAAFIATFPVIIDTFGQFSILVFISNLLILPIVSLSTVLGLLNTLIALTNLKLGILFSFINYLPLRYIVWVIETLAKSPVSIINVNFNIMPFQIFIYYLILFIFILYKDYRVHLAENSKTCS